MHTNNNIKRFCVKYCKNGNIKISSYYNFISDKINASAEEYHGGMIVVSIEVNAVNDPEFEKENTKFLKRKWNSFKNNFKNFIKTQKNWYKRFDISDKAIKEISDEEGISTGWSIGQLFRGRFYDRDTGKIYNEKSFAIEIRGVPYDFIKKVAKAIAKEFEQKSVMVINFENNKMEFIES